MRPQAFAEVFYSVFVKRSSFKSLLNLRKAYIFQEFAEGLLSICFCLIFQKFRRPLCHKVNLPSCVARRPLRHKVNLPRCEARCRFIMACETNEHFWFIRKNLLGVFTWRHQKVLTKKLSILLSFYFHEVLQHLKTVFYTNFRFQRVLRFAIEDAWISRLLHDAAFSWRPAKLVCGLKTSLIFWDFAIRKISCLRINTTLIFMSSSSDEFTHK